MWNQIGKPVCPRREDDDGDWQPAQILLKGEIAINGYENIERL